MGDLTCAFTGHRPSSYKFGYDEEHPDCCKLKALMTLQIVSLIVKDSKSCSVAYFTANV